MECKNHGREEHFKQQYIHIVILLQINFTGFMQGNNKNR